MNSLVHGAARKANTPAQAHKLILKRLEGLLDERRPGPTVRASQTLALFSDGPAPLAKLTTQRARRLRGRSASRADGYDEDVVDEAKFTTLMISPGTAFSRALAERLDAWAAKRLAKGRGFRRVVLSDASVAGEGELKAFEYADTYGDRDVVVYGGDADLVAMALSRCPVWKSSSASGAPENSSLSHFSAMTRPSWLGRAEKNRHRHAIEQASRRQRGGRRDDSARTRRKMLISTQVPRTRWRSSTPPATVTVICASGTCCGARRRKRCVSLISPSDGRVTPATKI